MQCKRQLDNKPIEQVESFNYLGVFITSDGRCAKEIRRRIYVVRNTFDEMGKLFKDRKISTKTKLRLLNCYVYPILISGSECWTELAQDENRIKAAEIWFLRRMLRISRTSFTTNEEVLTKARI